MTGIDLAIGLGTAQRQTGDPLSRDLDDAAAGPPRLTTLDGWWPPPWPTIGDLRAQPLVSDDDKVQILELALERLSSSDPGPALVIAACAPSSPTTARSIVSISGQRGGRDCRSHRDDTPSCWSSTTSLFRSFRRPARTVTGPDR